MECVAVTQSLPLFKEKTECDSPSFFIIILMPSKIHLLSVGRHCKHRPLTYQAWFLLHLFLISQSSLTPLGSAPCLSTVHFDDEPGRSSCPASKQGVRVDPGPGAHQNLQKPLPAKPVPRVGGSFGTRLWQGWGRGRYCPSQGLLAFQPTLPPPLQLLTENSVSFPAAPDWE